MGTILVPHSNTSISYRGPCIAVCIVSWKSLVTVAALLSGSLSNHSLRASSPEKPGKFVGLWALITSSWVKIWKKVSTTVLYKDENFLWYGFYCNRSRHGNVATPLRLLFIFVFLCTRSFFKQCQWIMRTLSCKLKIWGKNWSYLRPYLKAFLIFNVLETCSVYLLTIDLGIFKFIKNVSSGFF